jgi:hypothetical protein
MFSPYPKIQYDLYSDGSTFTLTDITRGVVVDRSRLPDDSLLYTLYELNDGDRPDVVSHKIYGDVQYYWTFFIINDFLREGLTAWQLPAIEFNRMIEYEYGKYSALTTAANDYNSLNGSGRIDFSFIPLDEKYLPHLRLTNTSGGQAKIVKYDSGRHQIVVEDIHMIDAGGNRVEISRSSFIDRFDLFELKWVGGSADAVKLKTEWVDTVYNNISKYDSTGVAESTAINQPIEDYVFGKSIEFKGTDYRWTEYYNAAYEYYFSSSSDSVADPYEILTNPAIVSPTYKSFYSYEREINDEKRKLKIIRPDYIREFSEQYYSTLLDNL